jgi:thiamine kinase-like enzyme
VLHAEPGVLVLDLIEGRTFGPEDVRRRRNLERIVPLLRRVHRELPRHLRGPTLVFWVFHVLRDYGRALQAGGSRFLSEVPRLMQINEALEAIVGPVHLCGCHSDLLAANFIDDGKRLWLVDWEYGGYGTSLFDLGNVAALSSFALPDEARLLAAYYKRDPDEALWRRFHAMRCAAHLREAMWSMASEIYLDLPIDYTVYTAEQLRRFEATFGDYRERYGDPIG